MPKKTGGLGKGLDALFLDNDTNAAGEGVTALRLSEIEPNRNQPRKDFDEQALSELADSIREHGIIQPLLVRPLAAGGFQLVAGERRWRAARMLGLAEVPVVVREMSETQVMEVALIENLQREDLNPLEEANGYKELMNACGLTQEQVAKRVGKSRSAVANSLRLLNLPQELRDYMVKGSLSAGHAKALIGLEDRSAMVALGKEAAEKGLSVRETEKRAARIRGGNPESEKNSAKAQKDTFYQEMELALSSELGRKVRIRVDASGSGVVEIEFYNKEDLGNLSFQVAGE